MINFLFVHSCGKDFSGKRNYVKYKCFHCKKVMHRSCMPEEITVPRKAMSKIPEKDARCPKCKDKE